MTAPQVLVKDQGLETELKRIWDAWVRTFPHDASVYLAQVQARNRQLWVSSGMSRDGTFAYTGIIPDKLYFAIISRWPEFFRDPKNYMVALRIFMGEDNLPKARKLIHEVRGIKEES